MPAETGGKEQYALGLRALHLCTGAGGGILGGLLVGHVPVCAVEIDPYCQRVLIQRQQDGLLPPFPIWDDVRTFDGHPWHDRVDILHAGFPCQPFSTAGQRKGAADKRNLWPDVYRIIGEVRPRYVFLENVPGLLAHAYFGTILGQLAAARYDTRWCVLGADDVGANHHRKRLWILVKSAGIRCQDLPAQPCCTGKTSPQVWHVESQRMGADVADAPSHLRRQHRRGMAGAQNSCPPAARDGAVWSGHGSAWDGRSTTGGAPVCHANVQRCQEQQQSFPAAEALCCTQRPGWWGVEPDVGRVAHGVAHRMDRLRALGNGQVPLSLAAAWHILTSVREE